MSLEHKAAVVTGGARGIGLAIARRLMTDGARVAVIDLSLESGEAALAELGSLAEGSVALQADVTNYGQMKAAVAAAHRALGSIDILINNAGIDKSEFFINTDEALWDRLLGVNYKGFLIASHVTIPYMMEQQAGAIVSLGSDAGRVGNSGEVVYCGAKAAIMASSKALARELARYNIRVNCVAPGPVQTELLAGLHEGEKGQKIMEAVAKAIPMKRIGTPEDVADVVAFFVSDDARYITGQVLSVDGGLTMIG